MKVIWALPLGISVEALANILILPPLHSVSIILCLPVLLTDKILNLSGHINKNKKDKHSSVGLLRAVNKRKKLLEYLKKNKIESYKNILMKLNLRK